MSIVGSYWLAASPIIQEHRPGAAGSPILASLRDFSYNPWLPEELHETFPEVACMTTSSFPDTTALIIRLPPAWLTISGPACFVGRYLPRGSHITIEKQVGRFKALNCFYFV